LFCSAAHVVRRTIKEVGLAYVWCLLKIGGYRSINLDANPVAARDAPKANHFRRRREAAHLWSNLR